MSNSEGLMGSGEVCPAPFLAEANFPSTGGYILGRVCASVPGIANGESCCLPCNSVYWFYPNNFYNITRIPGYIAIGSLALCIYLLLAFAFLPKKYTNRHYLNTCFVLSNLVLELGFAVPVLVRPQQCYNEITPNDYLSSMTCAWSGAFVIFGGVAINSWVLVRALNMHLLICWNITPGNRFFYAAQVFAWGLSIVLLGTCLSMTGVSFRFGDYCHVNHHLAIGTLWAPLLSFAGLSMFIQLSTFIYCLHVYLTNARSNTDGKDTGDGFSSAGGSTRAQSARAVYRRVRRVLQIQWRGLAIAFIVVSDVVFFSLVFIILDNKTDTATKSLAMILPWVGCLVANNGDKDQCLTEASNLAVNEGILIATLALLSITGFESALLIGSPGMITYWKRFFKSNEDDSDFLPLQRGRGLAGDGECVYEMPKFDTRSTTLILSPETNPNTLRSPVDTLASPRSTTNLIGSDRRDYYTNQRSRNNSSTQTPVAQDGDSSREYLSPRMSVSSYYAPLSASPPDLMTRISSLRNIDETPEDTHWDSKDISPNARTDVRGLGLRSAFRGTSTTNLT